MKISQAFTKVSQLYMDTAPIIYFTEQREGYVDKMRAILTYVADGHMDSVTCAVTLPETLIKPLQNQDMPLVQLYRNLFYNTQGFNVLPVTVAIGERAAQLRAKYQLRTPDALHVATALDSGCEAFLTNDLGLRRVTELAVLVLDDLELDPSD